jgi:uncharacterized RDD family membrane protein YckC
MKERGSRSGRAVGTAFGTAWRLVVRPVRVVATNPHVDVPRRLEEATVGAATTPAAQRTIDGLLAGPLPELIGRSMGEHDVVQRIVAEAVASTDVPQAVAVALESERTRELVDEVLRSPAFKRLLDDVVESTLTEELLTRVLSSPQVRRALAQQSTTLAGEASEAARHRTVRLDTALERAPRRLFGRPAREPEPVPYAGIATRGLALVADAGLVALVFLVGAALVGLLGSLVELRPAWLVGTIAAVAGLLLELVYFVGFWTTAGQTPGMRLMGLRVLTWGGVPPGFGRSVVRLVGLGLAIIPCFAGFLPALVDDRRRALPDFMAGTVVVYDEERPPPAVVSQAAASR